MSPCNPNRPARWWSLKWNQVYYIKAALILFTVSWSLYLNHRLVTTHARTVAVNMEWVARLSLCDLLGKQASAVNVHGNNVLQSHDVDGESARMRAAVSDFDRTLNQLRQDLPAHVPAKQVSMFYNDCASVRKEFNDLTGRIDSIFSSLRDGKLDQANAQGVSLGEEYDQVLRALDMFRVHLRVMRKNFLDSQTAEIRHLARFEWLLGGLVILVVSVITVYGVWLQRHMSAAEVELRESEGRLRAIWNSIQTGIVVIDSEAHQIVDANPVAIRLIGVPREQLVGASCQKFICPAVSGACPVTDLGRTVDNAESFLCTATGERRSILKTVTPVSLGGRPHLIENFIDITDHKRAEADLENLHRQLLDASRQAGMAEMATTVLHNVGNVLNSLNVSFTLVSDKVQKSKMSNLAKVAGLLQEHRNDMAVFLSSDPKGTRLPEYLIDLTQHLTKEQAEVVKEMKSLIGNVEHIMQIVSMQQDCSKGSSTTASLSVADLVEDALRMNAATLARHNVQIIREYGETPPLEVEKHKVLQILVNLIRNGADALDEGRSEDKRLTLRVSRNGGDCVHASVIDNGVGIRAENLTRIFEHGFTTRKNGHGFGLHSGALAAKQMGGNLTVHSDGPGKGAMFTLELPFKRAGGT